MVKPKKSFGQHFLHDQSVVSNIAHACATFGHDAAIEVGPGEGVLTKVLLPQYKNLMVVELDRESVEHLSQNAIIDANQIVSADFLKWSIPEGDWLLVGNFPYNISSQIVFKMLDHKQQFVGMVGMFQKEVAERIVSKPGTKTYGIVSVLVQAFYEAEYLFTVEADAFRPPPKVQSGVIRLRRKQSMSLDCDEAFFKRLVKQAFNQRRKMLRNTLKEYLHEQVNSEVEHYLQLRPEQLHYEVFVKLARVLKP